MNNTIHDPNVPVFRMDAVPYRELAPGTGIFGPLRWADEQSGILPSAVLAYFGSATGDGKPATPNDVEIVRAYAQYYINAPCWEMGGMEEEFARLRESIKTVASEYELAGWLNLALDIGIDPF